MIAHVLAYPKTALHYVMLSQLGIPKPWVTSQGSRNARKGGREGGGREKQREKKSKG